MPEISAGEEFNKDGHLNGVLTLALLCWLSKRMCAFPVSPRANRLMMTMVTKASTPKCVIVFAASTITCMCYCNVLRVCVCVCSLAAR